MVRLARLFWTAALIVVALGFALWGGLALYFQAPFGESARIPAALGWAALMLLIAFELPRRHGRRAAVALGGCLIVILAWWSTLRPAADRDWSDDVSRTVTAEIAGDTLTVRNVRNFDWRSDTDYTPAWEDRVYDLRRLEGIDLWSSTWAGEDIAHILLSFDFGPDTPPLAWSIELRKEKGEVYSALAGFFRQAELVAIAADERDVIRVRATVRDETVRLYRMRANPQRARAVLQVYVDGANRLAERPSWYNTLTTNCTTTVFQIAKAVEPGFPLDWRVLVSGHFAEYAYDRGSLDTTLPFAELKRGARINERALAADREPQPEFSRRLREGVPNPRAAALPAAAPAAP